MHAAALISAPTAVPPIQTDPADAAAANARQAGLRYVVDEMPGIRRLGRARFRYVAPDGAPIQDERELARIRALAIPPAWSNVWICPITKGHLQASGRDAKGRKQYRYHNHWREVRDATKFERMEAFAASGLPAIRSRVTADLGAGGLPRNKVLALVVRLLEATLIRVGNEEYARMNGSFGLTTMRNVHATVSDQRLQFRFRGKSGKDHSVSVRDRRLARLVRQCKELPGQDLFQYLDREGVAQSVSSGDVNEYLRETTGEEFTAKDFRTWAGTVLAVVALEALGPFESEAECKRNVVLAMGAVSRRLGNTPAVCRRSYVHPAIIEAYAAGGIHQKSHTPAEDPTIGMQAAEARTLALIRRSLRRNREAS